MLRDFQEASPWTNPRMLPEALKRLPEASKSYCLICLEASKRPALGPTLRPALRPGQALGPALGPTPAPTLVVLFRHPPWWCYFATHPGGAISPPWECYFATLVVLFRHPGGAISTLGCPWANTRMPPGALRRLPKASKSYCLICLEASKKPALGPTPGCLLEHSGGFLRPPNHIV